MDKSRRKSSLSALFNTARRGPTKREDKSASSQIDMENDKDFVGYCEYCDIDSPIYEKDILLAYKNLPERERKYKCPKCKKFLGYSNIIPF